MLDQNLNSIIPVYVQQNQSGENEVTDLFYESRWRPVGGKRIFARALWPLESVPTQGLSVLARLSAAKPGRVWNRLERPWILDAPIWQITYFGPISGPAPPTRPIHTRLIGRLTERIERARLALIDGLQAKIGGAWAGRMALALLTGERRLIPHTLKEFLQGTFLWHICVISGLHVALVLGLLVGLWRRLTLPMRCRFGVLALCADRVFIAAMVCLFPMWFGFSASALRGLGFYCAHAWVSAERHGHKIATRLAVVAFLIAMWPHFFSHAGFWMSVVASFGYGWAVMSAEALPPRARVPAVMIMVNIWMIPWMGYIKGVLVWPALLLSPLIFVAVIGVGALSLVLTLLGAPVLFQNAPDILAQTIARLPAWAYWHAPLCEQKLWLIYACASVCWCVCVCWARRRPRLTRQGHARPAWTSDFLTSDKATVVGSESAMPVSG